MSELPPSPHKHISQTLEKQAGERFGPAGLPKWKLAQTLNLQEDQISPEEWVEIYEFSVNAGSSLIRTAIKKDLPEAVASGNIQDLLVRIKMNKDNLLAKHDIFHAAETYRLTGGKDASAKFVKLDDRELYTSPESAVAELYPVLFLVLANLEEPLPVLLSSIEGRKQIYDVLTRLLDITNPDVYQALDRLYSDGSPASRAERQEEYENLVKLIVINDAKSFLRSFRANEPLLKEEEDAIQQAFKEFSQNPPKHYQQFAEKVFSQTDWEKEPRLFLDELLTSIRQIPE